VRWSQSPHLPFRAISASWAAKLILKTEIRNKIYSSAFLLRSTLFLLYGLVNFSGFSRPASVTIIARRPRRHGGGPPGSPGRLDTVHHGSVTRTGVWRYEKIIVREFTVTFIYIYIHTLIAVALQQRIKPLLGGFGKTKS